jgi:hypothetical protein
MQLYELHERKVQINALKKYCELQDNTEKQFNDIRIRISNQNF